MASTILQLAHDAADDPALSLTRPATLFPTDDDGDTVPRKLVRALTRACRFLAARYEWQALKSEHTFTTVAAEIQPTGLPTDILRPVENSMWVAGLQVTGPVNDSDWAAMRVGRLPQPWPAFRIYGDQLHLWPLPTAGQSVTYQYISTKIGTAVPVNPSVVRLPVTRFSADTDQTAWDDELITLGLIAEYRKGERFDYAQDQADFEMCLANRVKADGGSRILSMRGRTLGLQRPAVTLIYTPT